MEIIFLAVYRRSQAGKAGRFTICFDSSRLTPRFSPASRSIAPSVIVDRLPSSPINICLNARFATEPCANVTISDHLVGFRIYGNSTLERRRDGRADKAR